MVNGALAIAGSLLCATGAVAAAGVPVPIDAPGNGAAPQVAYDPSTGTTYVAWTAPGNAGIELCVYPANAFGCSGGGAVLLTDPADTGTAAPVLSGLVVLADGEAVVLGASAQGATGTLAWASPAGGADFLAGDSLQNGGAPISPVSLLRATGNAVALGGADVGLLDDTADEFSDSAVAGPASPTIAAPNANPQGHFPGRPSATSGPQIGAQPAAAANSAVVVTVGDNATDGSFTPPGCHNHAASGYSATVATVNGGSNAAGTLNGTGLGGDILLACAAKSPVLASGGSGIGVLEEEGSRFAGQGSAITMDWRPFHATTTGGSFGAPVELQNLAPDVVHDVNTLSVVEDRGTGVYAMWTDLQGLVLDYSADGGAHWSVPATVPALDSGGTQADPVIAGVGNGTLELAYTANPGTGNEVFLEQLNYAAEVADTPTTMITSQTAGTRSGAKLTIPSGTVGETDTATIQGPSAADASGTIAYELFSKDDCDAGSLVFSSAGGVVSAGVAAASPPITTALRAGRYWWQAIYGGNAPSLTQLGNLPSSSDCGLAVLTVVPGTSIGAGAISTASAVTVTVTPPVVPCAVTATLTAPGLGPTTAGRKPPAVFLGRVRGTIHRKGAIKVVVPLSLGGSAWVKRFHGTLKATLTVATKAGASSTSTSRTVKITPS